MKQVNMNCPRCNSEIIFEVTEKDPLAQVGYCSECEVNIVPDQLPERCIDCGKDLSSSEEFICRDCSI